MAHDKCTGTWENSRLGGVIEGNGLFEIFPHAGSTITGIHKGRNNSRIVGTCSQTKLEFCLIDANSSEVICYINGVITTRDRVHYINGKFQKPLERLDNRVAKRSKKKPDVLPDDWTAERPGT